MSTGIYYFVISIINYNIFVFSDFQLTMKCIKLNLQERSKPKTNKPNTDRPRRFCQKRMVNPEHDEDPRWTEAINR